MFDIDRVIKNWFTENTVIANVRFDVIDNWDSNSDCTLEEFVKAKAYNAIYDIIVNSKPSENKIIKKYIIEEFLWKYIYANNHFNEEQNPITILYCNILTNEFMKYISTTKFYQDIVHDIIKKHYMSSFDGEAVKELNELLAVFVECVDENHTCQEVDHDVKVILENQIVKVSFNVPKNLSDEELVKYLTALVKGKYFKEG